MTDSEREPTTLGALIERQARLRPRAAYLIFEDDGRVVTYRDLDEITAQAAHLFASLGVARGDKVALLLPNVPEFVYSYFGAMRLGAAAGPLNTALKGPEIAYILNDSEAKVLVTEAKYLDEVERVRPQLKHLQHVLCVGTPAPENTLDFYRELYRRPSTPPKVDVAPEDLTEIIYTSGTTGNPKGVMLNHRNMLADARYISEWFRFDPSTRMNCILPLFHVNAEIVTTITPLYFGGSVVLTQRFTPSQFWKTIERYRVNVVSVVPTILSILLARRKSEGPGDLSSVRFFICGAAPLPVEVQLNFEKEFGIPVFEGYGLSETTCYSSFNPPDLAKRKVGSIGVAVGNEMCILDDENRPMPDGEMGEICIRGDNVMSGYYKMPEATARAFEGGWFHSGDLGFRDADGFYYIRDRKKDMIIRGGENIYPREIDEVLYKHPKIRDAATIGVPNAVYGEEVKSYVVVKEGESLEAGEVLRYCRDHLADYKCPKSVAFVDEIPKGPSGKLLRRALRDLDKGGR
ncbi:MAG TPA: long-chain-fatty-acid--CoA ligase [Planctomycetota bacterium]|nr:long-chain-fatty-acid--CoA ligase [Planctomycetota bacterium]